MSDVSSVGKNVAWGNWFDSSQKNCTVKMVLLIFVASKLIFRQKSNAIGTPSKKRIPPGLISTILYARLE
jgi:hypothetical protein